jgi:hypothetical protein
MKPQSTPAARFHDFVFHKTKCKELGAGEARLPLVLHKLLLRKQQWWIDRIGELVSESKVG